MSRVSTQPARSAINESVVDNYTELIDLTEFDRVSVSHATYGGSFYRSADQSSPGKIGTRIRRTDLVYMDRVWDGRNYLVDWADITTVYGGDSGAALQAILTAYSGLVSIHGRPDTVYTVKTRCVTTELPIHLRDIRLKRVDCRFSATSTDTLNGATTITVDNPGNFVVGDQVLISDGVGAINTASSLVNISSIVGNVITVNAPLTRVSGTTTWAAGATLFTAFAGMFLFTASTTRVVLERCEFDGNFAGNSFTCDWKHNVTIASRAKNGVVTNCVFVNIPCENMFAEGNWTFTDCYATNLYGSFSHGSGPGSVYPYITKFNHCVIDEVCKLATLTAVGVNDHSEGAITWSSTVGIIEINDCSISNAYQRAVGNITGEDNDVRINNSTFLNCSGIVLFTTGANTSTTKTTFTNCAFHNCGDLAAAGTDIRRGHTLYSITMRNCTFRGNTRLWFQKITDLTLENINIIYDDAPVFLTSVMAIGSIWTKNAAVQIALCDRVKIKGIWIDAPKTYVTELDHGFMMFSVGTGGIKRKDIGGTDTDYYYGQHVDISDVSVMNCRNGFLTEDLINRSVSDTVEGWQVKNIRVYGPPDTTHTPDSTQSAGIIIAPGVIADDLTYYSQFASNTLQYPMVIYGIHSSVMTQDGLALLTTRQRGAIVTNARIIGPAARGFQIGGTTANRSNCNVFVANSFSSHATHTNVDPAVNSVSITHIGTTTLPLLTNEIAQKGFRRAENAGVY